MSQRSPKTPDFSTCKSTSERLDRSDLSRDLRAQAVQLTVHTLSSTSRLCPGKVGIRRSIGELGIHTWEQVPYALRFE